MAAPVPYTRGYGFGNYQITYPSRPLPGDELDTELDAIAAASAATDASLAKIQRSDGALANGIVTPDALSSSTLAYFVAIGINPRGAWLTATVYAIKDLVTQAGAVYMCAIPHTSGVFATDLAAGKWALMSAAPANQTVNTADNVTFASVTTTANATVGGNLAVTGHATVTSYQVVGGTTRVSTELLRVVGDIYVDTGIVFGGYTRKCTVKKTNQTSGSNCDLFTVKNNSLVPGCAVVRLKVWVFNTDVQGNFVVGYWEVPVFIISTGGSDNSAVGTVIFNQIRSVNTGIINLSTTLGTAVTVSGDSSAIHIVPTLSGTGGATKVTVYAEAECIGDNGPTLAPIP